MANDLPSMIVLYDGVCGLCNRLVRFVLKRDRSDRFRFASLQSEFAAQVLRRHGANPSDLDTMYVVRGYAQPDERLAARSDAAVLVLQEIGGIWRAPAFLLRVLPQRLRDWGYNLVARNRYRIFGKYDTCLLPEERYRHKFIDV
jgi:predicted DCC family thiol-disulfide oxidoreductase YuxK